MIRGDVTLLLFPLYNQQLIINVALRSYWSKFTPFGALAASNIAPGDIVIHMDVMYACFAGAKNGHMGCCQFNQASTKRQT